MRESFWEKNKVFILIIAFLISFSSYANTPENMPAEKVVVSGRVIDEGGAPVSFATIFIKESSHGTMADEDGKYSLKVNVGSHVLCVSMLGYEDTEKNIVVKSATPLVVDFVLRRVLFIINFPTSMGRTHFPTSVV